ncbi:hypothetical protein Tco_1091867, partial [Tanacetum coccineum]
MNSQWRIQFLSLFNNKVHKRALFLTFWMTLFGLDILKWVITLDGILKDMERIIGSQGDERYASIAQSFDRFIVSSGLVDVKLKVDEAGVIDSSVGLISWAYFFNASIRDIWSSELGMESSAWYFYFLMASIIGYHTRVRNLSRIGFLVDSSTVFLFNVAMERCFPAEFVLILLSRIGML